MPFLDPIAVDATRPDSWPVMDAEQVRESVARDMRVLDGVPAAWWGPKEVLVATDQQAVALRVADELARRDLGTSFADLVDGSVVVDGPHRAVLVGWPASGHVDWLPADDATPASLLVCRVRPARAQITLAVDPAEFNPAYFDAARWDLADPDLEQVLAKEDRSEEEGLLSPDNRRTCHTCRAWATAEHITSQAHIRRTGASAQAVARAAARLADSAKSARSVGEEVA